MQILTNHRPRSHITTTATNDSALWFSITARFPNTVVISYNIGVISSTNDATSGIAVTATLQSQVQSARGGTSVVHQLEVNTRAGWSARGHSLPNRTRSKFGCMRCHCLAVLQVCQLEAEQVTLVLGYVSSMPSHHQCHR